MPRKKLDTYEAKRDFAKAPEPAGGSEAHAGDAPRFVIQEHSARSMHWDLRLERDGVAVSWAVPRGVPLVQKVNHYATQTEDHPLEYLEFHGEIPKGGYGAGSMTIWDAGTYELEEWTDDKVQVVLQGERLQGRYGLIRTKENDWLIHRMEPAADPSRKPLPDDIEPMLAKAASAPPHGAGWAYEIKWDGVRTLIWCSGGRVGKARSRRGIDVTERYPELSRLGRQVGMHEVVLDGEIVAFDEEGRSSFSLLQERMGLTKDAAIKRVMKRVPVTFMIFDILWLDGHDTTGLTYAERRRLLDLLELSGEHWQVPPYEEGDGKDMLAEAERSGLEGVVAKRLDSQYLPGKRTSSWLKLKLQRRQEFVIGAWIEGEGGRAGSIGSLAVGYRREPGGPLVYAGNVGTGFTDEMLTKLTATFAEHAADANPFDPDGPDVQSGSTRWSRREFARRVHWLDAQLVCEVEFTEVTHEGLLRHPSFKGLRDDIDPANVLLEPHIPVEPHQGDSGGSSTAPASGNDKPVSRTATKSRAKASHGAAETVDVAGRQVRLSNPQKVLYPEAGFTKRDVFDYMVAIAPTMLPHFAGRPVTMKRYPDGVGGKSFFEKHAPSHKPDWIRTALVPRREDKAGAEPDIEFALIDDAAGLAWLANLAALELHIPMARAASIDTPDMMVFDLDPGPPATIVECCEVALHLREVFEAAGLQAWPKTSGRKGLQLYVPLNDPDVTYAHTRAFSNAAARLLEGQHPKLVVSKMTKALRTGKVLVDWSQNHVTKTTIGVYSLREYELPTVSTPVTWDEVEACSGAADPELLRFTAPAVLARVAEHGDLFAPVLDTVQSLPGT